MPLGSWAKSLLTGSIVGNKKVNVDKSNVYFMVSKPYHNQAVAETLDLVSATRIATAVAMHYGVGMEVCRMLPREDSTLPQKTVLFTIAPMSIDWRKVAPEHVLVIKSLAFDLASNVHQLFEAELEGATK